MRVSSLAPFWVLLLAAAVASCSDSAPIAPKPEETEIPAGLQNQPPARQAEGAAQIGTPMAQRVATIGLLNKRNNVSQDLEMKPGESRRLGNVIVRLSACERSPPWEMPKQTAAFVQVLVRAKDDTDNWNRIFSGWLFKESPSLNVVEHPVYDVWVKDCAMSFPGGDTPAPAPPAPPAAASESNDR